MGDDDEEASAEGGMNVTKYPVMPSLVSLLQMRNRLHLAFLGRKLMKWTALATGKELRRLAQEIAAFYTQYREEVKDAYLSLARCRYFIDHVNYIVLESVPKYAIVTVKSQSRSVSGVKVRNINLVEIGTNGYQYLGLARGGESVREARIRWLALIKKMVYLCQLRTTFDMIDVAHKNATKKQNVLQRNIIPRIVLTMRYILSELDEQEREESFRLKRFKQLKYKDTGEEKTKEPPPEAVPSPAAFVPPPPRPPPPPVLPVPPPLPVLPTPPPPPLPPVVPPPPPPAPLPPVVPPPPPTPVIPPPPPTPVVPPPPPTPVIPPPPPTPVIPPPPPPVKVKTTTIVEPPIEVEPAKVAEVPPMDPLEILITHIMKGINLVEEVEKAEIPVQVSGLTQCDLVRLKGELTEIIRRRQAPDKDKIASSCSCQWPGDEQLSRADLDKREGFEAAQKLMPKCKVKTDIPDYILKPQSTNADKMSEEDRLEILDNNVDRVICMTNFYQGEGLLSKSAEDFIKCCRCIKIKIQEFRSQRTIKDKLDALKQQVIKLEKISDMVQDDDLPPTTIQSFKSSCKEFMEKLERRKSCKGAPSVHSIEKLINQIGDSIALSNEAKKEGLVSESVEEFIASCKEIKSKIQPHEDLPKPRVIDELLVNINDITEFISKYKSDGLMSASIEKFYETCKITKSKLDSYKPPAATPGDQEPTSGDQEPTPGGKQPTSDDQQPTPTCQPSLASQPCGISTCPKAKASKSSIPKTLSKPCTESTCTRKYPNLEPQRSRKTKLIQDSKSPPSCVDSTCRVPTCTGSQTNKPPYMDYTCTTSTGSYSENQELEHSIPTCVESTCTQSTCSTYIGKPKSQRSCKEKDARCTESTCNYKTAKKESQYSGKSQSSQDRENQSTFVCIHKLTKPISRHIYKSDSCLISVPKYANTNRSHSALTEGKNKDPSVGKYSKYTTPEKSNHNSCDVCTSRSQSNISLIIVPPIKGKKKKNLKGHKSGICGVPDTSKGSCCDLSTARSKSGALSTVSAPISGQGKKERFGNTVETIKTVRRYKERDGSVIEETEKVIVQHRIFGRDEIHSETSSYATGSCESVQSTRTVNVCEVPVRGFIQTVRNVKSETLIRSLNLSHPYPPFAWSCVSVDKAPFGGGSQGNKTVQQDPFFCGSPASSDDDSESVLHM